MIPTTLSPVQLPKARGLTDVLMAPAGPGVPPGTAAALRRRLTDALAGSAGGGPIRVDPYLLRMALLAPSRHTDDDPFRWSPRTAKRSVGVVAVHHCIGGRARTPAEAVAITMAQLVEDARHGRGRHSSLARWLALAGAGGRAAVQAEATTWATRLFEAIEWDRLEQPPIIGGQDQWWDCPGTPSVGLRGRADVRVPTSPVPGAATGPGRGDRAPALFTMVGGRPGPTSRVELGLAALVAVLARPVAPAPTRVVGWWPDCGRALVLPVDLPMLRQTADAVVTAVRATGTGTHVPTASPCTLRPLTTPPVVTVARAPVRSRIGV